VSLPQKWHGHLARGWFFVGEHGLEGRATIVTHGTIRPLEKSFAPQTALLKPGPIVPLEVSRHGAFAQGDIR
jgi:hypothetical protein